MSNLSNCDTAVKTKTKFPKEAVSRQKLFNPLLAAFVLFATGIS
jgi:hypothetical protein